MKMSARKEGKKVGKKIRLQDRNTRNERPLKVKDAIKKKTTHVAQQEGIRGVDPRQGATQTQSGRDLSSLIVKGLDRSLDQEVAINENSIKSLALGVVLDALKKGWQSDVNFDPTYPFLAFYYLVEACYSKMAGSIPLITSAPRWFWLLMEALAPKTGSFVTASASYKWRQPGQLIYSGASRYFYDGTHEFYYVIGPEATLGLTDINGLPTLATGLSYTSAAADALQSLFLYYPEVGMTKRSEALTNLVTSLDTSAFVASYPEFGSTDNGVGAITSNLANERFIAMPLFTKFAEYPDTGGRGFAETHVGSGTACYIIPRLIEMKKDSEVFNKPKVNFKYYNFDEFFEVLSLTITKAWELSALSNVTQPVPQCTLSSQQVQILLRQTILEVFSNHMAQDLNLYGQSNIVPIVPFSVASNGVPQTAISMLLPLPLVENIRCCARKIFKVSAGVQDTIPVLGRPPTFAQIGNYRRTTGEEIYATLSGEVPLNLIDMSGVVSSTKYYVTPNGAALVDWCNTWNDYIQLLSTYLVPTATVGGDKGISALSTIFSTNLVTYIPEPVPTIPSPPLQSGSKQPIKSAGNRGPLRATIGASPVAINHYLTRMYLQTNTTSVPFLTPIYKYLKLFVQPVFVANENGFKDGTSISAFQTNMKEGNKLAYTISPGSNQFSAIQARERQSLLQLHEEFASQQVKGAISMPTEMVDDLREAGLDGRGGLFTRIAGIFGEDVLGIKGAKKFADGIGEITGF